MDLFTVSMQGFADERFLQFCDRFTAELGRLHMGDHNLGIRLSRQTLTCTVFANESRPKKREASALYRTFGRVMAEFVLQDLKRDLITKCIRHKYRSFDPEELEKLESYCMDIIQEEAKAPGHQQKREAKQSDVAERFSSYVAEHDFLHLEGFIRFRMKDYCAELEAVMDYAADEWLVERQYQEFISILKYFVCSQEIKRPAVHIYHCQGSEFVVLDEQFRPIETCADDRLVVETVDREINLEDMIISTLITVSPKTVYIHTKEPDMQVIRTIRMIYEERAVLCT